MTVRRLGTLVFVLALALAAAACGGDDGTVDLPGGGQVDIDQDGDGGITVEGPSGGEVSIGSGDYPEGWPADFPVPDGAAPAYSVGAAGSVSVWFATDQGTEDVVAFYESALPEAGYTVESTMSFDDASGSYTVMTVAGNGWTGGIYAGENLGSIAAGYEGDFDFWVSLSPEA